jgi:hypothetical protein
VRPGGRFIFKEEPMNHRSLITALLVCAAPLGAYATPSTQIWIPSTDIQKAGTFHLNVNNYVSSGRETSGPWRAPLFMVGPTAGLFDAGKVQAEAGLHLMRSGAAADAAPLYFKASPAFALGGYNFGTRKDVTDQNIVCALAARTVAKLGRFSAGYYAGNGKVLVDEKGAKADNGLLLSWDRSIPEVSDKLWAAVDYQGGRSAMGALSFGVSWAFSDNTSVLLGYDVYNNAKVAGKDTYTVQLDINF